MDICLFKNFIMLKMDYEPKEESTMLGSLLVVDDGLTFHFNIVLLR